MSNIDKITSTSNYSALGQEQLFTELTLEEGAVIEGGATYNLGNKAGITVNYNISVYPYNVYPYSDSLYFNDERQYDSKKPPFVTFDQKIGPGYEPTRVQLSPGNNNFDISGGYLILTTGANGPVGNKGPVANLVSP